MSLDRENDLGKISISENIIAAMIKDAFQLIDCKGRIWPATKKGRQIGNDNKFNINEFGNAIDIYLDEVDDMYLEFSVITKFGTSIKKMTDIVSDYVAEAIEEFHGSKPTQITIRIAGVKSKQIAKRNTEVVKRYEID